MLLIKTMKHTRKMGSLKSFRSSASCSGPRTEGMDRAMNENARGRLESAKDRLSWIKKQWETRKQP